MMLVTATSPRLRFINETSDGTQEPKAMSLSKRRIVRSQAMVAVRRRQRLEARVYLRLRWTDPKIGVDGRKGSKREHRNKSDRDESTCQSVTKYDFVKGSFSGTEAGIKARRGSRKVEGRPVQSVRVKPSSNKRLDKQGVEGHSTQDPEEDLVGTRNRHIESEPQRNLQNSAIASRPGPGIVGFPKRTSTVPPMDGSVERFGGGRRNPFESYPMEVNSEVYELIDQYTIVIPILMYGTRVTNPVQRSLYPLGMIDVAALHAILAYAARHIDSLHGRESSQRALRHTIAAVKAVNDKLRNGVSPYDDATVFAAALLAITERRFGCRATSRQHWVGLREILAQRGGLQAIGRNRALAAMITWNDLVWSKHQDIEDPQSFEWPSLISNDPPRQEMGASYQELATLLHNVEDSSYKPTCRLDASPISFGLWARRVEIFSENSTLHRTLIRYPESGPDQRRWTMAGCQIPCLIYLSVAFTEYAGCYEKEEAFLFAIESLIQEDPRRTLSPEHLLIRLLIGFGEDEQTQSRRIRQVMRLTHVVKLDSYFCSVVRERLWKFLSLSWQEHRGYGDGGRFGWPTRLCEQISGEAGEAHQAEEDPLRQCRG